MYYSPVQVDTKRPEKAEASSGTVNFDCGLFPIEIEIDDREPEQESNPDRPDILPYAVYY